jgi:hypothetical protein
MNAARSGSDSSQPRSGGAAPNGVRARARTQAEDVEQAPVNAAAAAAASSVVAGAAGMLGGIVLGRTKLMRRRKVFGVRLPIHADAVEQLADSIRDAGRQFGKLSGEVRSARRTAERFRKALK